MGFFVMWCCAGRGAQEKKDHSGGDLKLALNLGKTPVLWFCSCSTHLANPLLRADVDCGVRVLLAAQVGHSTHQKLSLHDQQP